MPGRHRGFGPQGGAALSMWMRAIPSVVLALTALINVVRGFIHAFTPDGGAHSIAGLDLTSGSATILSLFATIGLQQIVLGVFEFAAALRYRRLVTFLLAFQAAITAVSLINLYAWRPLPVVVPGQTFNLVLLGVEILALAIALRREGAEHS